MDIPVTNNVWTFLAVVFVGSLLLQFAFEGLVYALGTAVVWALSAGRIKVGERRSLGKLPPKLNGGAVFYYENSHCYIYQNYVGLIGLIAVLLLLSTIFGAAFWAR